VGLLKRWSNCFSNQLFPLPHLTFLRNKMLANSALQPLYQQNNLRFHSTIKPNNCFWRCSIPSTSKRSPTYFLSVKHCRPIFYRPQRSFWRLRWMLVLLIFQANPQIQRLFWLLVKIGRLAQFWMLDSVATESIAAIDFNWFWDPFFLYREWNPTRLFFARVSAPHKAYSNCLNKPLSPPPCK